MTEPIKETALRWAAAVKTRKPDNVLELYHPDGVLWGTLSPVVRHGKEAIHDYFTGFLQKEGLTCSFNNGVIRLADGFAFYSGDYEFTWEHHGKEVRVPARFSFVYKLEEGQWLIMEHHSSLFPELPFDLSKFME